MSGMPINRGRERRSPFEQASSDDHIDILIDGEDLEEPLLPSRSSSLPPPPPADDVLSPQARGPPVPWPALRRTSVTVRKLSPVSGFNPQDIVSYSAAAARLPDSSLSLFPKAWPARDAPLSSSAPAAGHPSFPLGHTSFPLATPARGSGAQTALDGFPSALPGIAEEAVSAPGATPAPQPTAALNTLNRAISTGIINSIIGMPVMLSFSAIIFRHPFFGPYLPALVKLVFLSSALHQAVFAAFSTMRFAVGQVQDVGLIFLSAIATSVADDCLDMGVADADILGTTLATLSLGTLIVGALISATGKLRLASMVQYCPLPVVGAYLAAVGFFMLTAGVSLASGVTVKGWHGWGGLLNFDTMLKLTPALGMAFALAAVQRRSRSPYSLPLFLLAVPVAFYFFVFVGPWSLDDIRRAGWMAMPKPEDSEWRFWKMYSLYNIHSFPPTNIHWEMLTRQVGKLAGLFFVVAFGSSMDIAAIQADTPFELDYNSELVTVGLSNMVTGIAGVGFTGSYIFSQTLFTLKMGVDSPVMGAIVSVAELLAFMLPINSMAYLPDFYFASLVIWIGFDILKDWLFIAAKKVSPVEYGLLVATFLAVNWLGLELGILLGVAAAAVHFAFEYARVSVKAFTVVPSRSGAVRPYHHRVVLEAFAGRVVGVALSGMVFFGSATTVAEQVMAVAEALLETQPHTPTATQTSMNLPQPRFSRRRSSDVQRRPSLRPIMSERSLTLRYDGIGALKELDGGLLATAAALQAAPLVLLLDLSRVHGIDATAARTFVTLHAKLQRRGVRLAITGLRGNDVVAERIRKLLVGQGLILQKPTLTVAANANASTSDLCSQVVETADGDLEVSTHCASWFPSMDEGLHWCEERFLEVAQQHGLCGPSPQIVTLEEVLRSNLEIPRLILGPTPIDFEEAAEQLQSFCVSQEMRAGDVIFKCGDMADAIYIVERGSVVCYMDFLASNVHSRAAMAATPGQLAMENRAQLLKFGPGGIVGDLDFMLQRPRSFTARCPSSSSGGSLWALTRTNFERLAGEAPQVLVLLQTAVLRLNCLSASHALEALERSHL